MIYPIKILQNVIEEHSNEIIKLEKYYYESPESSFFELEEINERKEYIKKLKDAIKKTIFITVKRLASGQDLKTKS